MSRANAKTRAASAKKSPGNANKRQKTPTEKPNEKPVEPQRSARDLSNGDWLMIRFLVVAEGRTPASAARAFGIKASTLRERIKRDGWRDPGRIAELPTLEEMIVMRDQKEILDALGNMSGKLETAMRSTKTEEVELAMKKAELVGKTARSTQSVARAADVSVATVRRIKATAKQPNNAAQDRAAIKAELDMLARTVPSKT